MLSLYFESEGSNENSPIIFHSEISDVQKGNWDYQRRHLVFEVALKC